MNEREDERDRARSSTNEKDGESTEEVASRLAEACEKTSDLRPREFSVEDDGVTWFLIEGIDGDWCDLTLGVVAVRPGCDGTATVSFHSAGPRHVELHPFRENVMRRAVGFPEIPEALWGDHWRPEASGRAPRRESDEGWR